MFCYFFICDSNSSLSFCLFLFARSFLWPSSPMNHPFPCTQRHTARENGDMNGQDEDGVHLRARAYLAVQVVPLHVACKCSKFQTVRKWRVRQLRPAVCGAAVAAVVAIIAAAAAHIAQKKRPEHLPPLRTALELPLRTGDWGNCGKLRQYKNFQLRKAGCLHPGLHSTPQSAGPAKSLQHYAVSAPLQQKKGSTRLRQCAEGGHHPGGSGADTRLQRHYCALQHCASGELYPLADSLRCPPV